MDGTVVLRKAGPSWFGWRRKDSNYEVRPTDQGLEVLRQGKRSWSLDLKGPTVQGISIVHVVNL